MKVNKIILISLTAIIFLSGCGNDSKTEEKAEENVVTEGKKIEDVTGEEFIISNLGVIYDEDEQVSTISGNVENITKSEIALSSITISLYDEETLLLETTAYIGTTIAAGEISDFSTIVTKDLSSTTDIKYTINK